MKYLSLEPRKGRNYLQKIDKQLIIENCAKKKLKAKKTFADKSSKFKVRLNLDKSIKKVLVLPTHRKMIRSITIDQSVVAAGLAVE